MSVTERERIALVRALEESLGPGAAATLMEYLPASGWREVATRTDLDAAVVRLDARMDQLEAKVEADVAKGFARQTATLVVAQLASTSLLIATASYFLR